MKAIVLLIALVVLSNAASLYDQYPLNFKKSRSFMALLTQVEAKLKSGGPLDQITKMLNDFKNEITDEQVTHDNLWEKQQAECGGEKEFRIKEIADAKGALQAATETLDGCVAQQARAKADLAITKTQLAENLDYLVIVESVHSQATYKFETDKTSYELVKKALEEGVVMVQEFISGESTFAQIVKHTNGVMKMLTKVGKVKLIQPVLGALIQMQKLDPEDEQTFKRVISLLNDLLDKVNAAFQQTFEDHQKYLAEYEENVARTKAVIANLEENKTGLETEIAALEKCIVTQTGITNSATAKIERNQRLLDDADDLCEAVKVQYEEATNSRKQELKLLNALRERVEARFGQLSQGVTERGTQDEFTYENQSAYEHKSFN